TEGGCNMIRALLLVTALLFLTTIPAQAIPTCVPGTMADYLACSDRCRLGATTVSDFSYSGFIDFFEGPLLIRHFKSLGPARRPGDGIPWRQRAPHIR